MDDNDLFSYASISEDGSIRLGKYVVCDGYAHDVKAAVFTHPHVDHAKNSFEKCMHRYPVFMSHITTKLLEAINNDTYKIRTQLHQLDFGQPTPIRHNGSVDYLTLFESKHMFGSGQVFLQTDDNVKIVYSGDISPHDKAPECDVLVIDSTHGNIRFDKQIDGQSLERRLNDWVVEAINKGMSVCIHAHRGKLQHIMCNLANNDNIPNTIKFLASATNIRMAIVYTNRDDCIIQQERMLDIKSPDAENLMEERYPRIEFRDTMQQTSEENEGAIRSISITGGFGTSTAHNKNEQYWIASDEHAEFTDLIEYVKRANPRIVITDNKRTPNGLNLATYLYNKLGIPARSMPEQP